MMEAKCRQITTLLAVSVLLFAGCDQVCTVDGVIQDEQGRAIEGALVSLNAGPSSVEMSSVGDGRFIVQVIYGPSEDVTLTVSAPKYHEYRAGMDSGVHKGKIVVLKASTEPPPR